MRMSHCWRTSIDINQTWSLPAKIYFSRNNTETNPPIWFVEKNDKILGWDMQLLFIMSATLKPTTLLFKMSFVFYEARRTTHLSVIFIYTLIPKRTYLLSSLSRRKYFLDVWNHRRNTTNQAVHHLCGKKQKCMGMSPLINHTLNWSKRVNDHRGNRLLVRF